jgi:hypothetical protein
MVNSLIRNGRFRLFLSSKDMLIDLSGGVTQKQGRGTGLFPLHLQSADSILL